MSSGNAKELRKATRAVVTDILPELLQTEVFKGLADKIQANLQTVLLARLNEIDQDIQANLKRIETNARDVQTFIMNQVQSGLSKVDKDDV